MHPINDKLKIKVISDGPFGEQTGVEKGIVVEIPDAMLYFGFNSFAFEQSLAADSLEDIRKFYIKLKGKQVFWESLQDRGRRFKENGEEYVFINMTALIAYTDKPDAKIESVDTVGQAGSFNL